tara:strand:- start:3287 stop:3688 length:402 start_codon:yes stop_codon:yes gene_type:complete
MNQTLAIIKPDAVSAGLIGKILSHLEDSGFIVEDIKMIHMDPHQAGKFYEIHKEQPFYDSLIKFMTSGPVVPISLKSNNAVSKLRQIIGATDPDEADEGTIRKLYAESKERNAIHASDSNSNATIEIAFFFPG